jgi:glycerol-3-phosphate dehydrogenase (NAD(P)+)
MSAENKKVAIIGGGAFGTALACVSARAGHDTLIFLRDDTIARSINQKHQNPARLPNVKLPDTIRATTNPDDLDDQHIILFAVPAQQTRASAAQLSPNLAQAVTIIACAKGLEQTSGNYQHQILGEFFRPEIVSVLSGPSFATDIARKLPTALTIASHDLVSADTIARTFSTPSFRLYSSDDLIGVETGGAFKNVLAIGVGMVRGMRLGASAEAALIARGFAELQRLGQAMGADRDTLSGLSGLGDLVLTCSSPKSRNFAYGMALGQSETLDDLPLAEGVHTAKTAAKLSQELGIDAPIISTVSDILDGTVSPHEAVDLLLSRPLRNETG